MQGGGPTCEGPPASLGPALGYHDATKHHFDRYARSLGYMDWATQPNPFRRYLGAPLVPLPREALAGRVAYDALYRGDAPVQPIALLSAGEFLRCAMGLSAWKVSRPSSCARGVGARGAGGEGEEGMSPRCAVGHVERQFHRAAPWASQHCTNWSPNHMQCMQLVPCVCRLVG
jgi:hypothetical protein